MTNPHRIEIMDETQVLNKKASEEMHEKVLELYLQEWIHRDTTYIKHMYTFFWASIIVSLLPYVSFVSNSLADELPAWAFQVCGMILSVFSFAVSIRIGKGTITVRNKYDQLLTEASPAFRHTYMKRKSGKDYVPMTYVLPFLISITIIVIDAVLIIVGSCRI